jgi:hypothetical protein
VSKHLVVLFLMLCLSATALAERPRPVPDTYGKALLDLIPPQGGEPGYFVLTSDTSEVRFPVYTRKDFKWIQNSLNKASKYASNGRPVERDFLEKRGKVVVVTRTVGDARLEFIRTSDKNVRIHIRGSQGGNTILFALKSSQSRSLSAIWGKDRTKFPSE